MKKRFIALILALMLLMSMTAFSYADMGINEARNGVAVVVELIYKNGNLKDANLGTGFFVGNDGENVKYLITNHHVIGDYITLGEGEVVQDAYGNRYQAYLRVYFGEEDYVEAYVVDSDESQDIAVLELEKSSDERKPLILNIPEDNMVGDAIYTIGYPGLVDQYIDATSVWEAEDATVSKGTLGRLVTESGTGNKWIESTDLMVSSGNSGGPIIDEEGNVIGVCRAAWGTTDNDNTSYMNQGVNIEPVMDMLTRNSIKFMNAEDQSKKAEEEAKAAEEEAKAAEDAAAEEQAAAEAVAGAAKRNTIIGVIAGVVALAIVAVVIVILKKSKNKKDSQKPVDVIPPTQPAKVKPVVRSLSPQHGGKKVAVKTGSIIIGRSKDCDIIFKEDTPGVSRRHCAITWDSANKVFIIKDMGSTYGTYLESGMRLDVNRTYRIKPGDSFYLGEKANMLKVEVE